MARDRSQTVKKVAERLKVSEATVRHRIRGEYRAIDIGKGWRIADCDLKAFLRSHATRARGIDRDAERPENDEPRAGGEKARWTR
ncbi:MAG TPA: helix-turn-helix domain-containing protein [Aurantimonas sp.]|uniref:Helix-turn-helix domain-containing protein n=1 Tax=Aurantimonas marianensis TaxID=2920428 RepID=A0A9X2KGR1_9HYPH|nr:helix-turn-helix domain-containing protein [Aurantimonas marianensis]MCP3057084.1 helix-turn-helix domain-containing protein [Aurantimonas marianensis]